MRMTIAMGVLVILSAAGQARAGGGCLDPGFGVAGKVTTNFTTQNDGIFEMALQADGKVVTAGTAGSGPALNSSIALARYNPDGSLDSTFGTGGKVSTNFSGGDDWAASLALQPDGRIVVAGAVGFEPFNNDSAVVRYLPDGTLDASFGVGGLVTVDFFGQHDGAYAVALQGDGKIVTLHAIGSLARWALVRYLPDGTLDASFGSGGRVITDVGPQDDRAEVLIIQPDGKLLVGGLTLVGTHNRIALARYETNGALDATFGTGGIVTTAFPDADAGAFALAVLPGGKILVGGGGPGAGDPDFGDLLLARYTSDGTLDASFGTGGYVLTDVNGSTDNGLAMAVVADGKILLAGQAWGPTQGDFVVVRYHADGSRDTSFGADGKVVTDFFTGNDAAQDVLLLGDGRIVLGGGATNPPEDFFGGEFALARYLPNCPPRCDLAVASPGSLWPPDRGLDEVRIDGVEDPDGDPVAITITGITQDEPTRSRPGDPSPDGFGVGTSTARLRAERDGSGNGRVYVVSFSADDGQGGACSGQVAVGVPHDRHGTPVDDGQVYDSTAP